MSLCIDLPARAGELITLLCISCVFFRLLIICDVESVLSLLAAVLMSCCLWARRARRHCHVVQSFSRRLDDKVAASSPMPGLVDG